MRNIFSLLLPLSLIATTISGSEDVGANPAYVCSFCVIALGLIEESAFQLHLQENLQSKCEGEPCKRAVEKLVLSLEAKAVPEELCRDMSLCTDECSLFSTWPVNPLPPKPIEWPVERRLDSTDLSILKPIFTDMVKDIQTDGVPTIGVIAAALSRLRNSEDYGNCGYNITCHIIAFVDGHLPLQDHDGDRFAVAEAKRFRGSDWRGYDCDDKLSDVYPGRMASSYDPSVDHNCNGIYGGNETGSYEEIFCSGTEQRGLIILGDSATAHFHIPPQWLTADGWNMDQLLPDAENELDFPMCSWGTGHVTPEECPYQYPIDGVSGVLSLYSQMRDRNRCNNNDFQNIGVNGARMTSSMKLVDSMGRDQTLDYPVLVWLALIGNDVCNGHPGYDHMTTPDEFYEHAMESLRAIDETVPAGSHVISLALFDGELLYSIMHAHQHPIGCSYEDIYDFMNCEEENPCWGWLNSDREVRLNTTRISNSLNDVYRKIEEEETFNNFKFIFYDPDWVELFSDYTGPMSDLIEPADGFHPSQTGNALFAKKFFEWMVESHPEAVGPVNPHNEEIDALFFSGR
mmetsp:Transcript_16826/g.25299  ORF Transcript_16826/g.25299 Transcript_16826/m.25299 type:complete len:572 (+) Transcript_16826:25-1740(+)